MDSRLKIFTPKFEIDNTGSFLCKTYTEHDTLKQSSSNTYYYRVQHNMEHITCKSCQHYFNNDCYFPKEKLDKLTHKISQKKFKCTACNSRIKRLFNILSQILSEKQNNVHTHQLCRRCYQVLRSRNPKKFCYTIAIIITELIFFLYLLISIFMLRILDFPIFIFITMLWFTLPAFLYIKPTKRWKYIKKNILENLDDYFIKNEKKNEVIPHNKDFNDPKYNKNVSNYSTFQISEWALNKLDQIVEIPYITLESEGVNVKPMRGKKKFTVKLDPEIAEARKLAIGDVIQLINPKTKKCIYRILEKFKRVDKGTRSMRLNTLTRYLLSVEINDQILIKKVDFGFAKKIFLVKIENIPSIDIEFWKKSLKNIVFGIGEEFLFDNLFMRIPLKVVDYVPQLEAVILNSDTKIEILKEKYSDIINKKELMNEAIEKIRSFMKQVDRKPFMIKRQYIPELFDNILYNYSEIDGLPILKHTVLSYLLHKGLQANFSDQVIYFLEVTPQK